MQKWHALLLSNFCSWALRRCPNPSSGLGAVPPRKLPERRRCTQRVNGNPTPTNNTRLKARARLNDEPWRIMQVCSKLNRPESRSPTLDDALLFKARYIVQMFAPQLRWFKRRTGHGVGYMQRSRSNGACYNCKETVPCTLASCSHNHERLLTYSYLSPSRHT